MKTPQKPKDTSAVEEDRRNRIERRKFIDRRRNNDPLYNGPTRRFRIDRRTKVIDRRGNRKLPPTSR